jgi:hypothetical protein
MAKQKGSAKIGRSKRSPSHSYYNSVKKAEFNKARNVEKEKARQDKAKNKHIAVPRGTARAKRRAALQPVREAA